MLSTILLDFLPLLLDLMLVLFQITLKLLMLRHLRIIHIRPIRGTIFLYLFLNSLRHLVLLTLVARNYTFSSIHTVCGLQWTTTVYSGGAWIRVHRKILLLHHILQILLLFIVVQRHLWSHLLLLLKWDLMIVLLQKQLRVFNKAFLDFAVVNTWWSSCSIWLPTLFQTSRVDQSLVLSEGS